MALPISHTKTVPDHTSCRECSQMPTGTMTHYTITIHYTEITSICGTTDKTCVLDHLPANQLRDNITSIVSVIKMITNTSLDEAVMPRPLKHTIVRPLLKKQSLDIYILSNYRPASHTIIQGN